MVIKYSGNVGIGTTAPSAQLHTTGTVRFANFGAGTVSTDANGNLSVSSDERLKNISGSFNRGLSALMSIDPISYHWKKSSGLDTENLYTGFSAQNVQQSIPEAVGIDNRGYLTLSDRPILATAVNAIKQLADTSQKFETSLTTQQSTLSDQALRITKLTDTSLSIDEKLTITGTTLTNLNTTIVDIQDQLIALTKTQTDQTTLIVTHTAQLATLEDQMNEIRDANQAVIDFATALNVQSLIYKDSAGNLDLTGGKITAQSIEALGIIKAKDIEATGTVAGASITSPSIETTSVETSKIKGKTLELDSDTSGKAKIVSGDTEATIETPEATKDAKIYITPEGETFDRILFYDDVEAGKSFKVKIKKPTDEGDIHFNWLIIK